MPPVARIRLAEAVAAELRERIISGELSDGDRLPSLEGLTSEFEVGPGAAREALRILEHEGLVTVQRGNVGGAIVHRPTKEAVAYTLSLVLRSSTMPANDVARTLGALEATAAGECAKRQDRAETVLPALIEAHEAAKAIVGDAGTKFSDAMATFHERVGSCCGSPTLALLIQILTRLWAAQEEAWFASADDTKDWPPRDLRERGLDFHARVIAAIERGDRAEAIGLMEELAEHPNHFGPGVTAQPLRRSGLTFTGKLEPGKSPRS